MQNLSPTVQVTVQETSPEETAHGVPPQLFVALDDSACAARATKLALLWAQAWGATLTLTHILATPGLSLSQAEQQLERQCGQDLLEPWRTRLSEAGVRGHLRLLRPVNGDSVAQTIVAAAEAAATALIVMGTHGRQGLDRWLDGSIAEAVVRHTHLPVLVAHDDAPLKLPTRVLVALDGGAASERALEAASALLVGWLPNSQWRLLHVVPDHAPMADGPMNPAGPYLETSHEYDQDHDGGSERHWRAGRAILARAHSLTSLPAEVQLQPQAGQRLAQVILQQAQDWQADLLVLGTHNRIGLERWLFGSVAQAVITGATVPVLVARTLVSSQTAETAPASS
jgi:nucleotide-binding universal stress UspA family protein